MNCANHPDRERAAFCQSCGKPLCTDCVRNVGTSVFCEPCLAARVAANVPRGSYGRTAPGSYASSGYTPGPSGYPPAGQPPAPGEPNPALAGLLGIIPGVGAMYNEQYAKGIVHLIVFAVLVSLADANSIFLLFVFGWIFYMAIEAHHTARARRDGTPLPNPFGLNDLSERLGFGKSWPGGTAYGAPPADGSAASAPSDPNAPSPGASPVNPSANPYAPPYSYTYVPPVAQWGAPQEYGAPAYPPIPPVPPTPPHPDPNLPSYRRLPSGAIWLIGLGLLFLLANTFHVIHGSLFGPILVIGVGVWLFIHRMLATGQGIENDGTPLYRWRLGRALSASFWVVLVGILWLLDVLGILSVERSWPVFLIASGVMMFFRRAFYPGYGYGYAPQPGPPPVAPAASTALVPSDPHVQPHSNNQEGR